MKRIGFSWAEKQNLYYDGYDVAIVHECWYTDITISTFEPWWFRCCIAQYDGWKYFLFHIPFFMFRFGTSGWADWYNEDD